MSNSNYYACSVCKFILTEDKHGVLRCPHHHKEHGIINIGVAERYRDLDDDGYNNGFPMGKKHKCKNCNNGKKDLNFK